MPISCNPQDLIGNASQFCCITGETAQAVKLYLLRHIAGLDDMTPQQLLAASSCWMGCVSSGAYKAVEAYLLCQIANSGGTPTVCAPQEGANSPVGAATPDFIGQLYHETGDDTYWRSTGLTNADWTEISGGVVTNGITWGPNSTQLTKLEWASINGVLGTDIETLVIGSLASITTGDLDLAGNSTLISLSFPDLVSVQGSVYLNDNLALVTLDFSQLVTIGGDIYVDGFIPNLNTVLVPNWVPTDGTTISFNGASLDETSVDLILHRNFLAGLTTATIDLSGGTNATPSVAGQADKAALILAGCTVTTN